MSDWAPYLVQAKLHTMPLRVQSCSRGYRNRIATHPTPGTKGDAKRKHGRESIVDRVVVLLTVPEVAQFEQLADRADPILWTHPLLPPVSGYIESFDVPADIAVYGYFRVSFSFVQAYDSSAQQPTQRVVPSPKTSQTKANNLYNDFLNDLDGLDDIPTDSSGNDFNNAASAMGDAFEDVDATFDTITDPLGDGTWRDLSRTLDVFQATAGAFIDAAREIEDSIGAIAYDLQTAPVLIGEVIGDAVDDLKTPASTVASFVTTSPSDLFSMMADAGVEIAESQIATLMEDNGISDPFYIPAGLTIAIPVAA